MQRVPLCGKIRDADLIVGLAKNAKYHELREPFQPVVYVSMPPAAQESAGSRVMIRSSINLERLRQWFETC